MRNIIIHRIGWNGEKDYPKYTNAYIEEATWADTGHPLTEQECERWEQDNPITFNERVHQSLIP